jgi:hypothetical protein
VNDDDVIADALADGFTLEERVLGTGMVRGFVREDDD